jgi:hypothetical protein
MPGGRLELPRRCGPRILSRLGGGTGDSAGAQRPEIIQAPGPLLWLLGHLCPPGHGQKTDSTGARSGELWKSERHTMRQRRAGPLGRHRSLSSS